MRGGGKADLVVDHDMHGAAGLVTAQTRQAKAFGHDALTGKGRVAVQKIGMHLCASSSPSLVLLGADLAQTRPGSPPLGGWVRGQRQVDSVAVKFAVGRGAEVVFHIARAVDIFWFEAAALKFVKDRAVGFCITLASTDRRPRCGMPITIS